MRAGYSAPSSLFLVAQFASERLLQYGFLDGSTNEKI